MKNKQTPISHPALDGIEFLDGSVPQKKFHKFKKVIELDIVAGSTRAIKLNIKGKEKWLPKGQLRIFINNGILELWISSWIYNKEESFLNPPLSVPVEWHFAK